MGRRRAIREANRVVLFFFCNAKLTYTCIKAIIIMFILKKNHLYNNILFDTLLKKDIEKNKYM